MSSDWDCLERAHLGDETAWRELYQRHQGALLRITTFITGSVDAAQDIAQESFVRLLNRRIKHHRGNLRSYLATIAYRLALKEKKRMQRYCSGNNPSNLPDESLSPLDAYIRTERDKAIAQTIHGLPAKHRDVLILRFYGGHSYRDIAKIMKTPLGTVKSRMFHAVKTCQIRLREKGVFE